MGVEEVVGWRGACPFMADDGESSTQAGKEEEEEEEEGLQSAAMSRRLGLDHRLSNSPHHSKLCIIKFIFITKLSIFINIEIRTTIPNYFPFHPSQFIADGPFSVLLPGEMNKIIKTLQIIKNTLQIIINTPQIIINTLHDIINTLHKIKHPPDDN